MHKTIIYTFRTNRFIEKIIAHGGVVFVFGPLKKDLEVFQQTIASERPDFILGLASVSDRTRFESKAMNSFGTKKILPDGEACFDLDVPNGSVFPSAKTSTRSFCNWTAYHVAKFLKDQNIKSLHMFVHFNSEDLDTVLNEVLY